MKNKIILVTGDPNSINSEIIYKSWRTLNSSVKKRLYVITNFNLLKKQLQKLKFNINLSKVKNINEYSNKKGLKIIDVKLFFKEPFNVSYKAASKFVINSLNLAHKLALNKNVAGIINCPISKKLLITEKIGVTEFLAAKCGVKNNREVMVIKNKKLAVCPVTTHIDVKQINKEINQNKIINKVKTCNTWFIKKYKKKPKIGILGLNPHNAELRKNSEEIRIIIPAVRKLKTIGINIKGPLVADTLFMSDYKKFDIIFGMYHDQIITPFKTLFKFDAINITVGLKYLRVSPDHGVASELVGKNKANPLSLIKCIDFINKY